MFELGSIVNWKVFETFQDSSDDAIDRAHYRFTAAMLIFFAGLIGGSQTFGTPVQCMVGAHFPKGWGDYVNSYCFVTRTYVPKNYEVEVMSDEILPEDQRIDVSYYQWIPYILMVQSLLFVVPHLIWNSAQCLSDVDFNFLVQRCIKSRNSDGCDKDLLKLVASDVSEVIRYRKMKRNAGGGLGSTGVILYCLSKLLYIANLTLQLAFLNYFIGHNRSDWGLDLIQSSLSFKASTLGQYQQNTTNLYFPRVSFCTFRQNQLGQINERSVQCLLMLNVLNEKLFVLLYIWFYLLLALSLMNFIYTVIRLISSVGVYQSHAFLQIHNVDERLSLKFFNDKLGLDGLLLLHFIKDHASFTVASDVAHLLYESEFALPKSSSTSSNPKNIRVMAINGVDDFENGPFLTKEMPRSY